MNILKSIFTVFSITLIILIFNGCEVKPNFPSAEEYENWLPSLEMDTIYMVNGNTAYVRGYITYEGEDIIDIAGISWSRQKDDLEENQAFIEPGFRGLLETTITDFRPDEEFYFTFFAGNKYGYSTSEPFQFMIPPPGPPTIPCTIPENEIYVSNGLQKIQYTSDGPLYANFGEFGIDIWTQQNYSIELEFHETPYNKVYKTIGFDGFRNASFSDRRELVYMTVQIFTIISSNTYTVRPGGEVYFVENTDGTREVHFCDLTFEILSNEFSLQGNALLD